MVKCGPFYQTAGMVGLGADGMLVPGGAEEETRQILRTLLKALPDFGLGLADLTSATIYSSNFQDFPLINKAWEEVFTADVTPARAPAPSGLPHCPLGAAVEIEFRLYKP